ncbi:TonB-dependent receptor [Echinicola sp. CAU 1574]|uniref:TonB-dependent receptor n=1 Tax=Echinicola arenosa TaxID=2774144 RepID=A0ABR9AJH9_9BACT|nr:TonB-dependent receptor [Echinicola arenosa]MBD8488492.1 TonB-dependent receptor [Echinicola arenosa]
MKKRVLKLLLMGFTYSIIGLFMQVLFVNMLWATDSNAQSVKSMKEVSVNVGFDNKKLVDLFGELELKTPFVFVYDKNDPFLSERISLVKKEQSVEDVLIEIAKEKKLRFKQVNNNISVTKASSKKKIIEYAIREFTVNGTVISSSDGQPIPGATVLVKNSTRGTVTDIDGNFSIEVPDEGAVLVISFVGYKPQEVTINNQSAIEVSLEEDYKGLEEVVVIGYGEQKKINVAGAVAQVDGEALQDRPVTNVSQALQGQIAGVSIQPTSGQPGAGYNITIRGESSLNGGGALVIVDGIPGVLDNINPNDIESISVLKDGASASIYGARASEGVILVTTKKGKKNQGLSVSYNGNVSINTPTIVPEQMSPLASAEYGNLAAANAGQGAFYPQYVLDALADPNVTAVPNASNTRDFFFTGDFDWVEYFYDKSFQQSHTLSVKGGGERNAYNVSLSWLDQNGYFSEFGPDNFDRYTLRTNLSNDLIPNKLVLNTNISFVNGDRLQASNQGGLIQSVFQAGRNQELYDPNGNYSRYRFQQNTLQLLREAGFDENKNNRFEGRIGLNYNIISGLSLEGLLGYNVGWNKGTMFGRGYYKHNTAGEVVDPDGIPRWINQPNRVVLSNSYFRYYTSQLIARYSKTVDKHTFSGMVGISAEENYSEETSTQRLNILGNELPALNLGDQESSTNSWSAGEWGLLSYFGRVNYNYDDRYILEGTFRRDGSSRFSDLNKWGTFPSVMMAWRIDNESFMGSQRIFSNLKLRASYGETGNQSGIGLYDHIPVYTISNGGIPFPGGLGQQAWNPRLPSQQRTWETVKSTNIGLDMGFWDNRLTTEFNYYIKRNEDMLIGVEIPSIIGISVPTSNNGELETKGYEIDLRWRDQIQSIGLRYHIGFNFSDQKDKIVDLNQEFVNVGSGIRNIQGFPVNSIFAYRTDGLFQTQEEVDNSATLNNNVAPGDLKYIDIDGDGKITQPNDVEFIGTTTPRKLYGINLGAEWKGFDFSVFFQGVGKRNYYINADAVGPFRNPWDNWAFAELTDYWTAENTDAKYPRPFQGGLNYQFSDYWVQNASYIRLKNLQLGYSLPDGLLSKIGVSNARVYFSGENLWEKTNLILFDPEVTSQNGQSYPLNRNFSLGLNFTF